MPDNNEIIRRLLARTDVAEAWEHEGGVMVTNATGLTEGKFESYEAAVTWLLGPEGHFTGMACCPCLKCIPDIWKK